MVHEVAFGEYGSLSKLPNHFWAKVETPASGNACWNWMAAKQNSGHAVFFPGTYSGTRKTVRAYRFAYQMLRGPIPDGLVLDHLCRNPGCVNPWHLEIVTSRTNILRGTGASARNAVKTHCVNGHPLDGYNLRMLPGGWRGCRRCRNDAKSRHQMKLAKKRGGPGFKKRGQSCSIG